VPPLICSTLLSADPHRRFVVDYKCAVEYSHETPHTPTPLSDLVPLGESDVKFVRYVERYGNALVHAVDGDYLIIALLYYTACGLRDDNRIFLYRQLSRLGAGDGSSDAAKSGKRKEPVQPSNPPSKKCWVDMQLLFAVVARSVWQAHPTGGGNRIVRIPDSDRPVNPRTQRPFTDADAVYSAVCLMLCAGTDFSRPLPLLGPKRLWESLPLVVDAMLRDSGNQAADTPTPLNVDLFAADVLGTIYKTVFAKHIATPPSCDGDSPIQSLSHILQQLRTAPKLASSTTRRLPEAKQVRVTLQNIAWVIQYWLAYNSRVPSPLDGRHGFVRCPLTSAVTFSDLVP
jgi:hypothetical protein